MAKKIRQLDPETIRKIAAGEVVERPASIVKELIENSLDAGATTISIAIKNGGIDYIEINDNGEGIDPADLPAALELHATSKLNKIEDLNQILTFGFRGEALATINAAASVEIISATATSPAQRYYQQQLEPAARNQGTTVIVRELFRTIPARRKFLKSAHTEELNIRNIIKQLALANPEISFSYQTDAKPVFDLKPDSLTARAVKLLSGFNQPELIELTTSLNGINLQGIITHPRAAQKRASQFCFVNRRPVRANIVVAAVKKAYGNKIPPELNPGFILNLNLEQTEIDVNVHPRKEEVKFSAEALIFKTVLQAVDQALSTKLRSEFETRFGKAVATSEPRSGVLPGSFTISEPKTSYGKAATNPIAKLAPTELAFKFSEQLSQTAVVKIDSNFSDNSKQYLQIFNTYLLIERQGKLLIIDQHAADERIKYEKFKQQHQQGVVDQTPLLLPIEISLTSSNQANWQILSRELSKLGFSLELKGTDQLKITQVPTLIISKLNFDQLLQSIYNELEAAKLDFSELASKFDRVIATLACHSSIRAGEELPPAKVGKLLADLWQCQNPYTCPHGRPIVNEITKAELEKKFLRIK